jgi:hypothetical protein
MSAEPPPPWGQECPRSLRLHPGDLLVPTGTMRALLKTRARLSLRYAGFGLEPAIRDGSEVALVPAPLLSAGMLVLCDWEGWADILRLDGAPGRWRGSVDGLPGLHRSISETAVIGAVIPPGRSGPSATPADRLRLALRWPAVRFTWRRVERAPLFGGEADRSVEAKYEAQIDDYLRMRSSNLTQEQIDMLRRHVQPSGEVLVAGSGAAGEVVHLAGLGYRVTGFDVLPGMTAAGRRALDEAGVRADLLTASLDAVDLGARRFGAIYFTPLLYSFLAGKDRRIAAIRRLAGHLDEGGCLMLSGARPRGPVRRAQLALAWLLRRLRGDRRAEWGDWYTLYMSPAGTIGRSYLHVFSGDRLASELRAAGFRSVRRLGGHVVATFRP